MSMERKAKNRAAEFGKRGRETVEDAEHKPSALQRLAKASARWWGRKQPPKKKAVGFNRPRT